MKFVRMPVLIAALSAALVFPVSSFAHCDSVAGPVAKDVKQALESGQLSPVLKWIRPADEPELQSAFNRALLVRKNGGDAASLADQFFLETAVRLHRASEGESYTGLKSALVAEHSAPGLVDEALQTGSFGPVRIFAMSATKAELDKRIEALERARKSADTSPELGREYVRRYIELVHYVERLRPASEEHSEASNHLHQE